MLAYVVYKQAKKEMRFSIADQLRNLRESEGLSLEELSALTDISVKILQELEGRKAKRMGHLYRLACFYDKKIKIEFCD